MIQEFMIQLQPRIIVIIDYFNNHSINSLVQKKKKNVKNVPEPKVTSIFNCFLFFFIHYHKRKEDPYI